MMRILILGAALLAAFTSSLPAQLRIEARLGRHVAIGADLPIVRTSYPAPHAPPPPARGCWTTVEERVWVPGECRTVWVPPVYGWTRDHCGRRHYGILREGYWQTVQEPGRYEIRTRRVWVSHSRGHRHDD